MSDRVPQHQEDSEPSNEVECSRCGHWEPYHLPLDGCQVMPHLSVQCECVGFSPVVTVPSVPTEDEFAFTPNTVEQCWRGSYSGDDDAYRTELLEDLSACVDWCFNPRDDDVAVNAILLNAILGAAAYIASLPCTCPPGDDDGPCGRCDALGRWHDERTER